MNRVGSLAVSEPDTPVHDPDLPRHRVPVVVLSVLAGAVLASAWSFQLVDDVIGNNVANTLLGYDAEHAAIGGVVAGTIFAFVSGLAATFTACNFAAFGAIAPMARVQASCAPGDTDPARALRVTDTLRPIGWLGLGMVVVSGSYGAIGVAVGDRLPQLSTATAGLPPRLLQASIVFGIIGLAFLYLGLATLRVVPDVFARASYRFPNVKLVVIGALIGGFLVGRPFPLFRKMFEYAVETSAPLYGAVVFVLQSVGNVVVMAMLFVALIHATRGRFVRWMTAHPSRATLVTAVAFMVVGAFTFLYWDVRLPAQLGYGWYPVAPWN